MYANPEQTILLPTAVPTQFGQYKQIIINCLCFIYSYLINISLESTVVCIEPTTVKDVSENDSLLKEPVSSSTPNKLNPTMVETCKYNRN